RCLSRPSSPATSSATERSWPTPPGSTCAIAAPVPESEPMKHRRFVIFGAVGVVALVVVLMATSLSAGLTYYLYPSEAIEQRSEFEDGARFRLAGMVVDGTI